MSRGLGRIQNKVLAALRRHGREVRLDSVVALIGGQIADLGARYPFGWAPTPSLYTSACRAVATLRRRGLVVTETVGTTVGRLEWPRDPDGRTRMRWRFKSPNKYCVVSISVDSLPVPKLESQPAPEENA